MFWTTLTVVIVLWLVGLIVGVGSSLLYAILPIAGIIFALQIFSGHRSTR